MKSAGVSEIIGFVADVDDTMLDNKPGIKGESLHEVSRLHALHDLGYSDDIPVLITPSTAELNEVAFLNSPVHSVEGAFWWLLTQVDLVDPAAGYNPTHPLVKRLVDDKKVSYRKMLATANEVIGANNFFGQLYHAKQMAGRLAIASAAHREDIMAFFGTHGFDQYFRPENIFAREDVTNPKPDPEVFIKAIQSMGFTLEQAPQIALFEDDPRVISAAKRDLGMFTCAVTTRFPAESFATESHPPDLIAKDFNEYADIFGLPRAA